MAKCELKKGQYYAAKFQGSNGDLIIGQVQSVRRDGDVILTNLLTNNRATKSIKVLTSRNHQVTKSDADCIVRAYATKAGGDKAAARATAVHYWTLKNQKTIADKEDKAGRAKARYRAQLVKDIRNLSTLLEEKTAQLAELERE